MASIGSLLGCGTNPLNTTAGKAPASAGPSYNSQSQPINHEYKKNFDAGNGKGLQEGTNWARKGWAIPLPLGISAMASTRALDIKPSRPEAWKHGFEKGFHDGYTSLRPITRKAEDYEQLSWSNALVGVKLYNHSEQQEGTIIRIGKSSGSMTVKFRNGTIEDKLLEGVAPVWFVKKKDEKLSPIVDLNPYAQGDDNELLTRLVIKPFLRSLLNDPDSLQDVQFVKSSVVKKQPHTYKVTLFYRAKNGFGALMGYQQTFVIRNEGTGDDLESWKVSL